jgi:hypothetical protein
MWRAEHQAAERARYTYDVSLLIKPSRPAGFNGPERMTKRDDLPLSALHVEIYIYIRRKRAPDHPLCIMQKET